MTEVLDPQVEAMLEMAKPRKQHEWLQQLVGEWEYDGEAEAPDKRVTKFTGTQRVRSIAGIWIVGEGEGEMPCADITLQTTMVITLGYDTQKARFVGSWVGSMMNSLWVYDGFLDEAERILTLESEGPSMIKEGETGKYRDVITLVNRDQYLFTGQYLGDDGVWNDMVAMRYRRTA
jgi:hypothetical protein